MKSSSPVRVVGRYAVFSELASGGMATVHLGRINGPVGFARTVAIKRLHKQFASDPEFVSMALDEARLAARIHHPNVVSVLDVVAMDGELFVVMDYIQGESLSNLIHALPDDPPGVPPDIAVGIMIGALLGLHAAHEVLDSRGDCLNIIHRDVSPQNIMVGVDGVPRIIDFGVAKAANRIQTTRDGKVKGKLRYMAPEQVMGGKVDRRVDLFAASVVLWEALTGRSLFESDEMGNTIMLIMEAHIEAPSRVNPKIPPELDAVVLKGLARAPVDRYPTALDMAEALGRAIRPASTADLGRWVRTTVSDKLQGRAAKLAEVESASNPSWRPGPEDVRDALSASGDPAQSPVSDFGEGGNDLTVPTTIFQGPTPKFHSKRLFIAVLTVLGLAAASAVIGIGAYGSSTAVEPEPRSALELSSSIPVLPAEADSVPPATSSIAPWVAAPNPPATATRALKPPKTRKTASPSTTPRKDVPIDDFGF